MKIIIITLLCALLPSLSFSIEKNVPITYIYFPDGYDDNDDIEIIVEGYTPSFCHVSPEVKVKKLEQEDGSKKFEISATATFIQQSRCTKVMIPFRKLIHLGKLTISKNYLQEVHLIEANNAINLKTKKRSIIRLPLKIRKASNALIDEKIYANVEKIIPKSKYSLSLVGTNTSDCFEVQDVEIIQNKYSIVLLPIVSKNKNKNCWPPRKSYFSIDVDLPSQYLTNEKTLLHIRTMGGNAINYIWDTNSLNI